MKQFNLQEYLKNPDRKIVTRDGRSTMIVCTDGCNKNYPIIALIENKDGKTVCAYTIEGTDIGGYKSSNDLFFVTEKKEGWINVYTDYCGDPFVSRFFETEEEAIENKLTDSNYINTVKIEWEE